MKRMCGRVVGSIGLLGMIVGCEMTTVARTELAEVVERDGVPFAATDIPEEILHRLSAYRLVIVGETHLIREHQEWMAALVEKLYERGFRQLLLEWPHMAAWLLDEYVTGEDPHPGWEPPTWFYRQLIDAVRDFNLTLPPGGRFRIHGIDVNLDEYGGAKDFRGSLTGLTQHLPHAGPLTAFLSGSYGTPGAQKERLEALEEALSAQASTLRSEWGTKWYDRVVEMTDVEMVSVRVREERDDHYDDSVRRREDEMKRLADLRLRAYEHRSLLNVGGNHAQKERLKGTDQEWLGDYLVHRSTAVGGSSIALCVTAAEIVGGSSWSVPDWSVLDASPENELWRLMSETWPGQSVFLYLDDSVFNGGVKMNFEGTIHSGAPKRHYDAFLQYPVAHRIRIQ